MFLKFNSDLSSVKGNFISKTYNDNVLLHLDTIINTNEYTVTFETDLQVIDSTTIKCNKKGVHTVRVCAQSKKTNECYFSNTLIISIA